MSGPRIDHDGMGRVTEGADAVAQDSDAYGAPACLRQPVRFQQDPAAFRRSNEAYGQVQRREGPVLKGQVGRDAAPEVRRRNRRTNSIRKLLIDQRAFQAKPGVGGPQMPKAPEARHYAELFGETAGNGARRPVRPRLHRWSDKSSRTFSLANQQSGRANKKLIARDQFKLNRSRLPASANDPCANLQYDIDRRWTQEVGGEARDRHRTVQRLRLSYVRQQAGWRTAMAVARYPWAARGGRCDEPAGLIAGDKDRIAHAHRASGQVEKSHPEGSSRVTASSGLDTQRGR